MATGSETTRMQRLSVCLLSESVECIDGVLWHVCHQEEIRTSENEDEDEEEKLRGAIPSDRWMLRKERAPLVRQSRTQNNGPAGSHDEAKKATAKVCVCALQLLLQVLL